MTCDVMEIPGRMHHHPGMTLFRLSLALVFIAVATYTAVVVWTHGLGLVPVFLGDIAKLAWPGQFNLDFMCLLALAGLWVAYRHRFGATGLLLGVAAFFGGSLFLSGYLLAESFRARGNVATLLLGANRAQP